MMLPMVASRVVRTTPPSSLGVGTSSPSPQRAADPREPVVRTDSLCPACGRALLPLGSCKARCPNDGVVFSCADTV